MDNENTRKLLPIGDNEKILTTVNHHWFAYVSVYIGAGLLCLLILGALFFVGLAQSSLDISSSAVSAIVILGIMVIIGIIAFSFIPVWIKKQELLVLTEEALLQVKKPSLFANKVSQLNLQHISDVTVQQNTLGTMFGFADLTIETPGEQDNYSFTMVGNGREKAKMIIEAHENYVAALESGQINTTLGARPLTPGTAWRDAAQTPPAPSESDDFTVPPAPEQ